MGETFWEWVNTLDPYTMELVLYDVVRETQEKGRELTDEELNEIREKYDPTQKEEETEGGNVEKTDEQEETVGELPECNEENTCSGGTVRHSDDPDISMHKHAE